jgi:hypothetical protein
MMMEERHAEQGEPEQNEIDRDPKYERSFWRYSENTRCNHDALFGSGIGTAGLVASRNEAIKKAASQLNI